MNAPDQPNLALEERLSRRLLDVFIRFTLVIALVVLCYQVFSPFLSLMAWALILAVTLYPAHQMLAGRLRGRQGLSATLLVLAGLVLIVAPTALLLASLGDSAHQLVAGVRDNTLHVPAPPASVAEWPVVRQEGVRVVDAGAFGSAGRAPGHAARDRRSVQEGGRDGRQRRRERAHIPGVVRHRRGHHGVRRGGRQSQPQHLRSHCRHRSRRDVRAAVDRDHPRWWRSASPAWPSSRRCLIGLILLVAGVPYAGVLAMIQLVLGIVQVPALLVTLPAIVYIWVSGVYGTGAAVMYTVLLATAGLADNVLKPLMLGRVSMRRCRSWLLGALGGLASAGILGMFVGAVVLALGYQIFMAWVAANPDAAAAPPAWRPPPTDLARGAPGKPGRAGAPASQLPGPTKSPPSARCNCDALHALLGLHAQQRHARCIRGELLLRDAAQVARADSGSAPARGRARACCRSGPGAGRLRALPARPRSRARSRLR